MWIKDNWKRIVEFYCKGISIATLILVFMIILLLGFDRVGFSKVWIQYCWFGFIIITSFYLVRWIENENNKKNGYNSR